MSHYYDKNPQSMHKMQMVTYRVNGRDFSFRTDAAVFSRQRIDYGTMCLISSSIEQLRKDKLAGGRLLDLGCGYGVVGIVMKRVFPVLDVVMSDINARAIALAKENAHNNGCDKIKVFHTDGWSDLSGHMFSHVLTNPPVRAGKATVFSFYEGACRALRPGGRLLVVLQKKQGAASSQKKLAELFGDVVILSRSAGYWVLMATKGV